MAKCPACSTDITENSRFCFSCGQSGMPEAAFATKTVAGSSPQSTSQKRASRPSAASATSADDALFGKGGMGEVYRADDLTLGQQVALKFLPESLVDNPYSLTRFRNEVRIARQVSHPNVCRVYDVGEIDGHFYLSMEYVDGEDLASLLRRIGRLPAAAHEKGVLHRDAPDLVPTDVLIGSEPSWSCGGDCFRWR